jgi:hypothetical protein
MRNWLEQNCPAKMDPYGYFHIRFPDPSVFSKTRTQVTVHPGQTVTQRRHSIADELRMYAKIICQRGVQNDVPTGIIRVKDYLRFDPELIHPFRRNKDGSAVHGSPRLFVTKNCQNTIWEFGQYRWPRDPHGGLGSSSYEVPYKQDDHTMDVIRYVLLTWAKPVRRTVEEMPPMRTVAYYEKMRKLNEERIREESVAY